MRTNRLVPSRRKQRRAAARRAVRLQAESLESRLVLAQTTGLFFNNPGASDGYTLFSPNTADDTYLIDKNANVVNTWNTNDTPGLLGYVLDDGSLIRAAAPNGQGGNGFINAAGSGGLIERFDWNGTKIWEYTYDSPTVLQHHDFEVMPNGNVLLIAWELKSEAEATAAGRDPSLPGDGYLYPDHIIEVQPDLQSGVGGTIVWQWHVWDHMVQDFDATKDNYYGPTGVADHPELIDLNFVSTFDEGGGQAEDWTHANGIDYNADLDQIVLSVREFSEFWVIDHSTTTAEAAGHTGGNSGMGGDLLYRWGNPHSYDRSTTSDIQLFYQHDAKWVEDGDPGEGNITVFNNGFGRPGQDFTTVHEIVTPVDGSGNYPALAAAQPHGPASPTWTYTAPLANCSAIISGTQRLPNGNTQITYGVDGTITEVTPAGTEVWKFVNPYTGFGTLGEEDPIPSMGLTDPGLDALKINFVFRAIDYPAGYFSDFVSDVEGRHVFYNNSSFDGNNPAINTSDDGAIDPVRSAYLPGSGNAVDANITGYDKGINGIMVDLSGSGNHASITAADFVFKVGNNNSPDTWSAAPAPSDVQVRTGAGVSGADRVVITWADNDIEKEWLEVQVLANANTGLIDTFGGGIGDVFFWGNAVGDGDTGNTAVAAPVNATDEIGARNNPHSFGNPATVDDQYDYNKDTFVNATDQIISRNNSTNFATQLTKINISTGGPFAPQGDEDSAGDSSGGTAGDAAAGDTGIASALAATGGDSASKQSLPANVAVRLESATSAVATALDASLLLEAEAIDVADDLAVDDELLDVLAEALGSSL